MAEIELNVMTRQCLSRRIASIEKLKCELSAWERERNCNAAKIQRHFQTGDAREKLISLYLRHFQLSLLNQSDSYAKYE